MRLLFGFEVHIKNVFDARKERNKKFGKNPFFLLVRSFIKYDLKSDEIFDAMAVNLLTHIWRSDHVINAYHSLKSDAIVESIADHNCCKTFNQ